jgi:UDP-4-amino-4,6-dideoxy-N-acetyl-beta-L-altrosamine transaminase
MRNIPYGRQNITEADLAAVVDALKSDFLTQGPRIESFEKAFSRYLGAKHSVAVSNGTAALHLAAMAMDIRPGQKVITSPITFSASANCVRYCGGDVAFADIDPETFLLDVNAVRKVLEGAPKGTYRGVIPVGLAGLPVDLEKFRELADEFKLWIIEDACHAIGGHFEARNGRKVFSGDATLADAAIFSFHPVKHITSGEGGMITVGSDKLKDRIDTLRTHGITRDPGKLKENHGGWYYELQELGYNYRITDFQAALGESQLGRANQGLEKRRAIAAKYTKAFQGSCVSMQKIPDRFYHAFHLFIIQVRNRAELYAKLRERGIYSQVHYIPVHTMPYYRSLGFEKGMYPKAEAYYEKCLSLPMFPELTDADHDYVIEQVLSIAK